MKLLLERDEEIIEAMKKDPELFFKVEKRLVPYVNADDPPTIIYASHRALKRPDHSALATMFIPVRGLIGCNVERLP